MTDTLQERSTTPPIYLTVSCTADDCRAIYRAYRIVNPPKYPSLINFCMFCGSPNVSVTQDHERDVLDVLATKYNKPPEVIAELLTLYDTLRGRTTFHKLAGGD